MSDTCLYALGKGKSAFFCIDVDSIDNRMLRCGLHVLVLMALLRLTIKGSSVSEVSDIISCVCSGLELKYWNLHYMGKMFLDQNMCRCVCFVSSRSEIKPRNTYQE